MQVLKTLIEDFGGEATSSSLYWKMMGQTQAPVLIDLQSEDLIRRELCELDRSGAVTLEETRSGNLVARITSDGAIRAYDDLAATRAEPWHLQAVVGAA